MDTINEVYAFLTIQDGEEGIFATQLTSNGVWLPLIFTSMAIADGFKTFALEAAKDEGVKLKLVKFSTREVVEEFE
jgi:hypothetical protein